MNGKFTRKITQVVALLVLMVLSASSKYFISSATEENLPQEEVIAKAQVEATLEKYVNYEVENQKGVLVQLGLKSGIEYEKQENYLPILASGIQIHTPEIEGKFPNSVELVDKTANNAQEPKIRYNQETGELYVIIINTKDLGKEITETQINDMPEDYSVILNYGEECYNSENIERELQYKAKAIKLLANEEKTKIAEEKEQTQNVKENIGNVIDIATTTEEIYNGYTKANKQYGAEYSTNYAETVEINIAKAQLGEKTTVNFETELENQTKPEVLYESSIINKAQVLDILGQEGNLKVLDEEGNTLGEINKDTEVNEDGIYKINYEKEISKIQVVTTTPQKVGKIEIQNNKKIKAEVSTEELKQVKETSKILVEKTVKEQKVTTTNNKQNIEEIEKQVEIYKHEQETKTEVKDSKTTVKFTPSSLDWTNERQNELDLDIELRNNSGKYNLFKNPSIEVQLPEEASKVILDEPTLINANGLQIAGTQYIEETRTIRIDLYGEQQKYLPSNIEEGTKIKIPAIIILNSEIEDKDFDLKLNLKNENTYIGKTEHGEITKTIKLHNFNNEIKSEEQINIKREMAIYDQQPAVRAGNTEQQTLGPIQLDIKQIKGDQVLDNEHKDVYEGEFIKYEITAKNTSNEDIENAKIVAEIPEDLVFADFEADYTQLGKMSSYTYEEEVKETIKDGTGSDKHGEFRESIKNKQINLEKIKAGESVNTYFEVKVNKINKRLIEYGINSEEELSTYLENSIEEIRNHLESDGKTSQEIDEIIQQVRNQYEKSEYKWFNEKNITTEINAYVEDTISSNYNIENKILKAKYNVEVQAGVYNNKQYKYIISVEGEDDEEVTVKFPIPNGLEIYSINSEYTLEDNIAIIKTRRNNSICIDLKQAVEIKDDFILTAATLNDTLKSNQHRLQLEYNAIEVNINSETEGEKVKFGEKIVYEISIENTSKKIDVNSNGGDLYPVIQANISDDLTIEKIEYNRFLKDEETGEITEEQNEISSLSDFFIPYGKTLNLKITATPNILEKEKNAECSITVSEMGVTMGTDESTVLTGTSFQPKTSRTITHTLLPLYEKPQEETEKPQTPDNPDNPETPDNPSNPDDVNPEDNPGGETQENSYTITGKVFNDENEDGIQQDDEKGVNSIDIYLLNEEGKEVKKTVTTSGEYTFSQVAKGNYYIVFKYDTNKYHISQKGKTKITTEKVKIDNKEITAGVTELLSIQKNTQNINLGLAENKKFDFKVENYITKVTVQTSNNTEETTFNNATLAKKEIKAKEIQGAKVTVEYKIKVTNNGEIAGTVGKVIDKLPQGFNLAGAQSGTWIQNKQGELISTNLENKEIKPGESQEVTLLATVTLSENSTGTFTNTATIENINNEQKIAETSTKNNTSKSEIIISVSTGAFVYIIITGILLTIIVVFGFKFNKLRKISLYMFSLIMVAISIFTLGSATVKAKVRIPGDNEGYYWFEGEITTKVLALKKDIHHAYRKVANSYEVIFSDGSTGTITNKSGNTQYYLYLLVQDNHRYLYNCSETNKDKMHRLYAYGGPAPECRQVQGSRDLYLYNSDGSPKLTMGVNGAVHERLHVTEYSIEGGESGRGGRLVKDLTDSRYDSDWNALLQQFGQLMEVSYHISHTPVYTYYPSGKGDNYQVAQDFICGEEHEEEISVAKISNGDYTFECLPNVRYDIRVFNEYPDFSEDSQPYYCVSDRTPAYGYAIYDTTHTVEPTREGGLIGIILDWIRNLLRTVNNMNGEDGSISWNRYTEHLYEILENMPFGADIHGDFGINKYIPGNSNYVGNKGSTRDPFEETPGTLSIYKGTLDNMGEEITGIDGNVPYETYITNKNAYQRSLPLSKPTIEESQEDDTGIISLSQEKEQSDEYIYIGKIGNNKLSLGELGQIKLYRLLLGGRRRRCRFRII